MAAREGRQLTSTVRSGGTLELAIERVPVPEPGSQEVLIRVEAAPINPSDLGMLFAMADLATVRTAGSPDRPAIQADVPPALMRAAAARVDQSLPAGNEGAGIVIAAGDSDEAQALIGRTVAVLGGAMYAEYRIAKAKQCLVLADGTPPRDAASCFVNPLTALGMVETMRLEGHTALAHTAAASNLGQMLQKICLKDGIQLVNVVRSTKQVELLKDIGARWVVDSSSDTFSEDLTDALAATGATIAFDATGGGKLAGQLLGAMEVAAMRNAKEFSRYGSTVHKQVYIYGGLERSPTVLNRNFGMAWGLGGWLLTPFLQRVGFDAAQRLRERVAAELTTTFASHYSHEISLAQALDPANIAVYGRQATGEKFLINPAKA
jgi:NADPH2:quinone reductase